MLPQMMPLPWCVVFAFIFVEFFMVSFMVSSSYVVKGDSVKEKSLTSGVSVLPW